MKGNQFLFITNEQCYQIIARTCKTYNETYPDTRNGWKRWWRWKFGKIQKTFRNILQNFQNPKNFSKYHLNLLFTQAKYHLKEVSTQRKIKTTSTCVRNVDHCIQNPLNSFKVDWWWYTLLVSNRSVISAHLRCKNLEAWIQRDLAG